MYMIVTTLQSYELSWSVDSYSPIEEYRLLYRKIKPYHGVSHLRRKNISQVRKYLIAAAGLVLPTGRG